MARASVLVRRTARADGIEKKSEFKRLKIPFRAIPPRT